VKRLLNLNADPNIVINGLCTYDDDGDAGGGQTIYRYCSALISACGIDNISKRNTIVEWLINAGANVNLTAQPYYPPKGLASSKSIFVFCAHPPLVRASLFGFVDTVELLIKSGADTNWLNCNGESALYILLAPNLSDDYNEHFPKINVNVVRALIAGGSDINLEYAYSYALEDHLHSFYRRGNLLDIYMGHYGKDTFDSNVVKVLVEAGLNVNNFK
jgi:hypothetical protein